MTANDSATPQERLRFFTAKDADPLQLAGEQVAVLGYGNLGRAMAFNLRDSLSKLSPAGEVANLVVGNVEDEYARQAREEGFTVRPIAQAVAAADLILILLPDEVIPEAFEAEVVPNLKPGSAILFASGYTLAYGLALPPEGIDVLLLAPRMGGEHARERFLMGKGYLAYVSVEQDASGRAWDRLLSIAHAAGVLATGALELDARREADLDLLVEQTVGAIIGTAIMATFTLGVEAGIPPEAMVLEMYMSGEMETVFQAFRQHGFFRAAEVHGPTAMYGGYLRTMELMLSDIPARFREIMEDIRSGGFAAKFQAERQGGYTTLALAQEMTGEGGPIARPIAEAEAHVRAMLGDRS